MNNIQPFNIINSQLHLVMLSYFEIFDWNQYFHCRKPDYGFTYFSQNARTVEVTVRCQTEPAMPQHGLENQLETLRSVAEEWRQRAEQTSDPHYVALMLRTAKEIEEHIATLQHAASGECLPSFQ